MSSYWSPCSNLKTKRTPAQSHLISLMLVFVFALPVKNSLFQSLLTDQRLGRTGTKLCWAVIATLNVILLPKMITAQLAALQLEPSYSFVRSFSCACSWWVAIVTSSCINIVWLACVAGWRARVGGMGSLSNEDDDGGENVSLKVKSRCFKMLMN